jgi:RNA polymerase sigma-70 factor (ECF subfamily)
MKMNDEKDISLIHSEYYPKIVGYLRRLVGEADAEDVAQEAFVKISRSLDGFRGEAQLSTWIYRIATNTAMDHHRKPSSRQAAKTVDIPDEEALSSDERVLLQDKAPLHDASLIRKDMNECIRGLVNDLPDTYRVVLMLGDLEGFTNAEIADILGLSLDTVKIRMHRARRCLKQAMDTACHLYQDERNELSCDRKLPSLKFPK